MFSRKVANGQAAIEQLIARTTAKATGGVVWAVDMTSGPAGLLIALLRATGQPVLYVPGRLVNRMAGAFAGEGKTDAKDSRTIAETFRSSGHLAAYAGLAPVPRDSGRVRGNLHRPHRYHRGLRRVFYLAALSAIKRPDSPSRSFYRRKREEGKRHTQALIALARRLVDVIWALLRDGREFHPSPPVTTTATA